MLGERFMLIISLLILAVLCYYSFRQNRLASKYILQALSEANHMMDGEEIEEVVERYGFRKLGTIYPYIKRLERLGFVDGKWQVAVESSVGTYSETSYRRIWYITPRGRDWLESQ